MLNYYSRMKLAKGIFRQTMIEIFYHTNALIGRNTKAYIFHEEIMSLK